MGGRDRRYAQLAIILYRMWIDATEFNWSKEIAA